LGANATEATDAAAGASRFGDLSEQEIQQIQSVVDKAGRPLDVVGSAARAERRAGSDIDYTSAWADYFNDHVDELPGMTDHGMLQGGPDPSLGPSIRFEPTNPTWP
jgi:hypothetical protein